MATATLPAGFDKNFNPLPDAKKLGFTPTSGLRTQAHQDYLIKQGLTKTRNSQHTAGNAVDFAVPSGMSKQEAIELARKQWPNAKIIPTNGRSIHATFPDWGNAPDVSNSRKRFGAR